jgi:actin-related protein
MKAINAALDDYDTAASSDSDDNMDADDHNNHFNDENDTSSFRSLSSSSSSWSAQSRQHRKQIMLENIYLSGGNTMFPGLIPRLTHELELCSYASSTDSPPFPPAMNTHAHAMKASVSGAPDRAYGAWCGAAMLLSVEQDYLLPFTVTKENYDEFGTRRHCSFHSRRRPVF